MNETQKKGSRKIIIALVALVALIAVLLFAYNKFGKGGTAQAGDKKVVVSVVDLDGNTNDFTYQTDAEFLGDLVQEEGLAEGEDSGYGLFITSVNGIAADDSKQQWWCLTKDGEMVMTGADATPLADGDHYEFTLTEGY